MKMHGVRKGQPMYGKRRDGKSGYKYEAIFGQCADPVKSADTAYPYAEYEMREAAAENREPSPGRMYSAWTAGGNGKDFCEAAAASEYFSAVSAFPDMWDGGTENAEDGKDTEDAGNAEDADECGDGAFYGDVPGTAEN